MLDQPFLCPHHVGNGNHRKIHPVRFPCVRINGTRSRGTRTAPQNIAADNEILVGVKRTAGTDHRIPPAGLAVIFRMITCQMCIAGQGMFHQNGIGTVGIELAVGFITDIDGTQRASAVQLQCIFGGLPETEIMRFHNSDNRRRWRGLFAAHNRKHPCT